MPVPVSFGGCATVSVCARACLLSVSCTLNHTTCASQGFIDSVASRQQIKLCYSVSRASVPPTVLAVAAAIAAATYATAAAV
jgi:hypothetical protein